MLRISELRNKDVINIQDGKRLGYIEDIDLDMEHGRIEAIIIPTGSSRMFSLFAKGEETLIHWRQIKKIGVDVILIDPDKSVQPTANYESPQEESAHYAAPINPFEKDPFEDQDALFDL